MSWESFIDDYILVLRIDKNQCIPTNFTIWGPIRIHIVLLNFGVPCLFDCSQRKNCKPTWVCEPAWLTSSFLKQNVLDNFLQDFFGENHPVL